MDAEQTNAAGIPSRTIGMEMGKLSETPFGSTWQAGLEFL